MFVQNTPPNAIDQWGLLSIPIPKIVLGKICNFSKSYSSPFNRKLNFFGLFIAELDCTFNASVSWVGLSKEECKNEFQPVIKSLTKDHKFWPPSEAFASVTASAQIGNVADAAISISIKAYHEKWYNYGFKTQTTHDLSAQALLWVEPCCKCWEGKLSLHCDSKFTSNTGGQKAVIGAVAVVYYFGPVALPAAVEGWGWAGAAAAATL